MKITVIYSGDIRCPGCSKEFEIQIERETISPGTPATTEIRCRVSSSAQDNLGDGTEVS